MKPLYKNFLALATGSSLFVVFAVVLTSSLMRYLFNAPLQWSEEVAKYGMIYGTMFGTVLCYLDDIHIKFGLLENGIPAPVKRLLNLLLDVIALGTGAVLAWSGYQFVLKRGGIDAPGTGLPMSVFQSAMVVGGICLFIAALFQLQSHFSRQQSKEEV
ncbi:TRAP-type C4-dicarboxylate transport system, small permease component [Marinobacterium lacunae]|uniref:TRAP transporter small permease protein n=1 Tax=Marinobacterium lacunae TaxID=1232683 RepID=A0A081FUX2_9GAMM|nr:TRAP transporter small permease [Marinobacterium lacunae]KEA62327.1 TRAP-type C4-dicarboxylate transport system, small permease component [Marinobacterium lacunae]MBR9882613.1 TRAP transporter small permease [Oceanospirillales bacterium]